MIIHKVKHQSIFHEHELRASIEAITELEFDSVII